MSAAAALGGGESCGGGVTQTGGDDDIVPSAAALGGGGVTKTWGCLAGDGALVYRCIVTTVIAFFYTWSPAELKLGTVCFPSNPFPRYQAENTKCKV